MVEKRTCYVCGEEIGENDTCCPLCGTEAPPVKVNTEEFIDEEFIANGGSVNQEINKGYSFGGVVPSPEIQKNQSDGLYGYLGASEAPVTNEPQGQKEPSSEFDDIFGTSEAPVINKPQGQKEPSSEFDDIFGTSEAPVTNEPQGQEEPSSEFDDIFGTSEAPVINKPQGQKEPSSEFGDIFGTSANQENQVKTPSVSAWTDIDSNNNIEDIQTNTAKNGNDFGKFFVPIVISCLVVLIALIGTIAFFVSKNKSESEYIQDTNDIYEVYSESDNNYAAHSERNYTPAYNNPVTQNHENYTVRSLSKRTIQFGSYPQTKVTNSSLIDYLNSCIEGWELLDYYAEDGEGYENIKPIENAYYADVSYGGDRYRAIYFEEYRPTLTSASRITGDPGDESNQKNNGYFAGNTYWFKYEPITWTVLDESDGLLISNYVLDSQPYVNCLYKGSDDNYYNSNNDLSNTWKTSSLRSWLNESFYYTAFSYDEINRIKESTVPNNYINGSDYGYDRSSTYDRVFILSLEELTNPSYGFNSDYQAYDSARSSIGTDYAKSQNANIFTVESQEDEKFAQYVGYTYYGVRTVGKGTRNICYTDARGYIGNHDYVNDTSCGVRPAIRIYN